MRLSLALLIFLMLSSCARVRSVSQTSIPSQQGKIVKAEVKNNIFFFFNFSTTYLNDLTVQLRRQCPGGKVSGILTKDVIITYFPIIYSKEHITAEGFCEN